MSLSPRWNRIARFAWLVLALACYLSLAVRQLGLPGLHYDEAREAGQNAMELLTGAPTAAFRDVALHIGGVSLPLMVQDYIGALNVYLAMPLLALTGIGVPNLRFLSVLTGLVALVLLERAVTEWLGRSDERRPLPLSIGGLVAVTLTACSPSFVFWSRQGIFVTNLTQPLVLLCIWQGLRWKRTGSAPSLMVSALAAGMALYAKLIAFWVVLPFGLLMIGWWLATRTPRLRASSLVAAVACFCAPLVPLVIFNVQTGGTFSAVAGNFGESYYGVRNSALLFNLSVRLSQLRDVLQGSHLWYLGGVHGNPVALVLAGVLVLAGLLVDWRTVAPPLALVAVAVALSLFTISDLFITHYALLLPLMMATVGVSVAAIAGWKPSFGWGGRIVQVGMAVMVGLWLLADVRVALQYHADLSKSGGLADHSDASYHLAYYLQYGGFGSPIALDWGMDSTVRYLSQGQVTPVEIFGYDSPVEPDAAFQSRIGSFLTNPDNVYLLRSPGQEVFGGRRAVLEEEAAALGKTLRMEQDFSQRDGTPLYEIWRAQ